MNFGGVADRFHQFVVVEIGLLSGTDHDGFAPGDQIGGFGYFPCGIGARNHDGTLTVGVNEIARIHGHAGHRYFDIDTYRVDVGMRGRLRAGQHLKAFGTGWDIPDRAVGNGSERSQAFMDIRLHLTPKGTIARDRIDILEHHDRGGRPTFGNVFVPGEALLFSLSRAEIIGSVDYLYWSFGYYPDRL